MNSNDIDDTKAAGLSPAADAAAEAPAKPKRTRKAATPAAATAEAAPADVTTEPSTEAPAPKPRARRKTAAAEPAVEAVAEVAPAEVPAAAEEAPSKPKRRTRAKADAVAEDAPTAAVAVSQPVAVVESAPAPVSPVAEAVGELVSGEASAESAEAGDAGGEGATEREGRGRNRRRRNRDRDGREPREGAEAAEGASAGGAASGESVQLQAQAQERFDDLLSGAFDAEDADASDELVEASDDVEADESADGEAAGAAKRVLAPEPDAPKLQKVLAQAGVGSRRDIEDMIAKGQITVNGEVAHVGQRISWGDRVAVAGKPIKVRIAPQTPRILAYHKPVGEVVTFNDPEGRPTVFRNLPRLPQGKWQSVGRLDLNTEGLLLFTNSGELANQLMHPRFGVEREYAVRVLGSLSNDQKNTLLTGVDVDGQQAMFKSIVDGGGEGVNRWYRVVITEGRNREVRKLFETVGLAVSRLIRIRYGTVVLPRGLRRGVYVELGDGDVRVIRQLAGNLPQVQERSEQGERHNAKRRRGSGSGGGPRPSRPETSRQEQRVERRDDRADRQDRDRNDRGGDRNDRNDRGGQRNEQRQDRNAQRGQQQQQRPQQDRPRRDEDADDFIPRHINPLEQTFDRRFATSGKRGIPQGFGKGGSDADQGHGQGRNERGPGGERIPDPMKTSMGYIGADAFVNRGGRGGRKGGGGGGGGGGRGRR